MHPPAVVPLCAVTYISRPARTFGARDLADLVVQATRANARHDVTALFYHNSGLFLQVIEGPQPAVEALYERILADPRHRSVTALSRARRAARLCPEEPLRHVDGRWVFGQTDFDYDTLASASPETLQTRLLSLVRAQG